jgi:hypothetical protein
MIGLPSKKLLCVAILVMAGFCKLWLIAGMEITDDSDDPAHYLEQILLHGGLCYGPGTGDVGKLFYGLGIPFRMGMEILFLLSVLLIVRVLFDWPTRSYLALGLFLFAGFNPAVEELLSHLMSDQVWLVELLMGFSGVILFAETSGRIRWAYIAIAAVCLGFSVITRSTFVPLLFTFLLWAVAVGALSLAKERRWAIDFPLIGGCFLCLYAVSLFYYSTCFYNSRINGFFGLSAFDSREYQRFYTCLQSVGDPTGARYFPVDDTRLRLIARAGPESRWFVDQLGKDFSFRKISRETYGQKGIALCWFHWAVFETIDTDGDLDRTFAVFKEVENEIARAGQEKRLKVRPVIPLPDGRVAIVLSAFPEALGHVASLVGEQPKQYAWAWNENEPSFSDHDFTRALHRTQVTRHPFREQIGRELCAFYSIVYAALGPCLLLAVCACLIGLGLRWNSIPTFTASFLFQQMFLAAFLVFFLWYALFDASGLLAVPRYLVYHNVMLPQLLAYYARKAFELCTLRK